MKIERLRLKNFRNIEDLVFLPDSKVNFLVGSNGQGKTSFLEGISLLSSLRSFRENRLNHLVRRKSQIAEISCKIRSDISSEGIWETDLRVTLAESAEDPKRVRKLAYINEKPLRSSTQYLSERFGSYRLGFHSIVFNPSDHDLLRGDPVGRRSYLDRVLSAEDLSYLKNLQKYRQVLDQRNTLLKTREMPPRIVFNALTEQMAKLAALLTFKRLCWLKKSHRPYIAILHEIAPLQKQLRIGYFSKWAFPQPSSEKSLHFAGQAELPSLKLLEELFCQAASSLHAAERKFGYSLIGPHRDDWAFFLADDLLKGYGSQGEVRSALLALKLTEIELFRKETGHRPLFLLDDFSSELDRHRREFLLDFLMKTDLQVFVTTTEETSYRGKQFFLNDGTLKEGIHEYRPKTSVGPS